MLKTALPIVMILTVSACSLPMTFHGGDSPVEPEIAVLESPGDDVLRPRARAGQSTTPAASTPTTDGFLGETLAGLGSPAEQGLWLRTGLVSDTQTGRVVSEAGNRLTLELRPSGAAPSAGSQISLAAMQSLGLTLGQLATLRVYVD